MNNNILITSAGQRVSLVRAFQKEAKRVDENIKVYTVDLNPDLAPACHVSDGFNKISRVTDSQYVSELIFICKEWGIKVIIPTIDTELLILSKYKNLFLDENIIPIISNIEFIKICRDKRITNLFFVDRGIEVPKYVDKNNLSFPVFLKPYDGSLSKDVFLAHNKTELTEEHLTNPKLMFMEYIDHSKYDEYTVDAYYDKSGTLKCAVPRKRLFVRAGEVNKGVTRKNEILTCVKKKLAFIDGVSGCLTMQFFFNPSTKRIVGIEINPRFGGGFPLSYHAGANYPRYILEEYIYNKEINYSETWQENLLMLRYDDEIFINNYEG